MIVSYVRDDGSTETVSVDDLTALEAAAIETAMDDTPWRRVEDLLRAQDPTAMRAVLWVARRRQEADLAFASFDLPGWRRRLTARIERADIEEVLNNILIEALNKSEDSAIDAVAPHLRKLAADPADVDAALDALGKGHLARDRADSEG
ncbi:hypothetical protein [Streptomyces sp. C10-9-1]|uniref:hypothetical protein n=1 Tax=Streptomyces sp. C10-9-1 TaxID=1859285 RepID=UPI003D70D6CA